MTGIERVVCRDLIDSFAGQAKSIDNHFINSNNIIDDLKTRKYLKEEDFYKKADNNILKYRCLKSLNSFQNLKSLPFCFKNLETKRNLNNYIQRSYTFVYKNKEFKFDAGDYIKFLNLSNIQKEIAFNPSDYFDYFDLISSFGLSNVELSNYFFPELEFVKQKLCELIDVYPEENFVSVKKNSCCLDYVFGKEGRFLNQKDFYEKIYKNVKNNTKNIKFNIAIDFYKDINDIKNDFQEKSCFETDFSKSSTERKNNIMVALNKFDGLVLNQGESFCFNSVTGERSEKNGYKRAKIISNGTFVDGYGGGVCQVSTTLYNACLLAGLEILEVHSHSLPVSYIEPSFDAMVNSGSSDLVVRNNTNGKIIITTSSKNDRCKVKIFGKKNLYKIIRKSEKYKTISAEKDVIETDYLKYKLDNLEVGEEKRLSYPKDGFYSRGYLSYYDEKGVLVETKKIRENKYNSTKGIVVKREN